MLKDWPVNNHSIKANVADLEQGLLVASIGLAAWDASQGQAFLHLPVNVISLDFLGTFLIKQKGTK
ncbi:MAG: hypothetical protein Q8M15_00815 [Bacteroidota bacterium]|nr:hypothetical protein [Bacteroidota bacterium]